MTSDNRLDQAIDDVAREMTAGDADPNLRVRVLARVESGLSRTLQGRAAAWRAAFATACAAGAVIALVIVATRGRTVPATAPTAPEIAARVPAVSPTVPEISPTVLEASPKAPARSARVRIVNPFEGEPLKEEPITVTPMTVAPIAPAALHGAEQLPSLAPIAVAPLDAQGESR
jgi:hypothetical protein